MKTCKDCLHYDGCHLEKTETRYEIGGCPMFTDKSEWVHLPCKVGDTVYKICPKCSELHNGNCENCAWGGCFVTGCDVGVHIYSDGSFTKNKLQVIERVVHKNSFITICSLWNIMYFKTKEEAQTALIEYDSIRSIEDRKERYRKYTEWEEKRFIGNIFAREEAEKTLKERQREQ